MKISISNYLYPMGYVPEFFQKVSVTYLRTQKSGTLISGFRYIFPVICSLFWLQRCETWHIYYKILLSRVRSPFWKCWINPVVCIRGEEKDDTFDVIWLFEKIGSQVRVWIRSTCTPKYTIVRGLGVGRGWRGVSGKFPGNLRESSGNLDLPR